jgi:predicted O-methyltransferase YrrM
MSLQDDICVRIAQTLASAPIHDHLGYEALAYLKLQGPNYLSLLRALHVALHPRLYVEIGVRRGDSLAQALPETRVVGIDPVMSFTVVEEHRSKNMLLASATSDEFFAIEANRKRCRGFDLAFIDGDHSFEQARRDFENLEALAGPFSIICLHDVIPMDERTAQSSAEGVSFHTGDVWRLMAAIVAQRKDLIAFTVACPPTGLGIVGRFGPAGAPLGIGDPGSQFPATWEQQWYALNIVPNNPVAILAALQQ